MPLKDRSQYNAYMREYRSKDNANMPTVSRAKNYTKEQLTDKFDKYLNTVFGKDCPKCTKQMVHVVDNHYLCLECEST